MKKLLSLLPALIACSAMLPTSSGDLNENAFRDYTPGELLGQNGWKPQALDEGRSYQNQSGRAEIQQDAEGKHLLVWNAGFGGQQQTRLLKQCEPTSGDKVRVLLEVRPGSPTLPGQFIFDKGRTGGAALRFVGGTLRLSRYGEALPLNTEIKFRPTEWNKVELRFNFEENTLLVLLNDEEAGSVPLPPNLDGISEINFFGGGLTFETALKDLIIQTVSTFED